MSVASVESRGNTAALFAGTSFYSRRVLVPLNQCASNKDADLPQLFCVHSISGNAGADFLALAEKLEPHVRVFGVQAPPALIPDIEFGKSIESIATYYADTLDGFQPDGVFHIAGYCVGAVIALEMAKNLQARGREVGSLVAIDGVPENTHYAVPLWKLRYWVEVAQNALYRARHYEMMRGRSMRWAAVRLRYNLSAIGKSILGMNGTQRFGGGYSAGLILDVSRYPPARVSFINRLLNAIFNHRIGQYSGEVIVYEAALRPLLFLPQIGRIWKQSASRVQLVPILASHDQIIREPSVNALANDLMHRINDNHSNAQTSEIRSHQA